MSHPRPTPERLAQISSEVWGSRSLDAIRDLLAEIDALENTITALTKCDCGAERGQGLCQGYCDRDD